MPRSLLVDKKLPQYCKDLAVLSTPAQLQNLPNNLLDFAFKLPADGEGLLALYEGLYMALLKNFNLQHLEGGHGTRPLPSRDTVNTWSALMTKLVIEEGYAAQKCRDTSAVIKTLEETLRPMEERGKELTRIQQYMDQLNLRLSQIKVDEATVYRKATLEKSTLGALRTQIAAAKALDVFWTRHQEAAACLQLLCASLADAQNAQTKALAARADWSAVQDHLLDSDIVEAYFSIKITRMKPFDLAGRLGSLSRAPTRPELTKPPCVPKYFGNPEDLHGMGNYGLAFDFAPGHLLLAIGEKPNYKRYAVNSQAWAQEHFSHLKEPKVHYASILADGNVIVGSQEFSEHLDKWEQCRELVSAKWEAGMSSSKLKSHCALVPAHFEAQIKLWDAYDAAFKVHQTLSKLETLKKERMVRHANGQ